MTSPSSRLIIGPFNRVEGDLEVELDVADGRVQQARVVAPMYRGFENMLIGHDPMDALTIVPRICGICSVSQSVAAAMAIAQVAGVAPSPNGQRAINLMLACENLADHLTHFYVFFMPDFTRPVYSARPWYAEACRRFSAISGGAAGGAHSRALLAARARWFELMGTLGGKWPHTGSVLPGGSSRAIEPHEALRMLGRLREMRRFLETTLLGVALEEFLAVDTLSGLQAMLARAGGSDLALLMQIMEDAGLHTLGPGPGRYLSYGAYVQAAEDRDAAGGQHVFAQGTWDAATAQVSPLDASRIAEDMRHSWMHEGDDGAPLHPSQGITQVLPDKPGAYTWNKAPRLSGQVMETGAIARQLMAGQPLVRSAVAQFGGTVSTRVLARLCEAARILVLMEGWLQELQPRGAFHAAYTVPAEGAGAGLCEAARGALGHWLRVEHGRIANYQIVAPTSWNFSPRDAQGQAGALEMALQGTHLCLDGERPADSVAVQHIVRSFDPCMVCTVH